MRVREPYFSNISGYPKKEIMPVNDVESYLNKHPEKRMENKENGGIIKATKAAPFIDNLASSTLSLAERKKREAKAQREHKAALRKVNKQA